MKKIMLVAAALLVTGISSAQNSGKKRFTVGFNAGLNHANVLLKDRSTSATIQNDFGFRAGLISSFAFSRQVSFDPKAELSFNTSTYRDGIQEFSINPLSAEFMTHLKIRTRPCPFSPYFILGPNVKIPLNTQDENTFPTRQDVALDLGIGFEVPFGRVRVSPELRYSIGLLNINQSSTTQDLRFHNISLILNFAGRPRV